MEFLRGVYAFMQVSRSSVSVNIFQLINLLIHFICIRPMLYKHENLMSCLNDDETSP